MKVFQEKLNQKGDTLVEVLLGTVVLSIVLAGAYTLSNRATTINLASYDRSRASALAQRQAELIRSARDNYDVTLSSTTQTWDEVKAKDQDNIEPLGDDCNDFSTLSENRNNEFYIDENLEITSQIAEEESYYRVWSEVIVGPDNRYVDAHVFVCWEGIGRDDAQKLSLVLRLEDNND